MKNRHATVVAYLALFVALSGTAYAATVITSKEIKNNTIKSVDVKDKALKAQDFKPGQLPQGPKGNTGPQGPAGPAGTAKGYAAVDSAGGLTAGRNVGVNSVTHPDVGVAGPADDNAFCFDLTFTPKIAVGSPFANNAGFVATAVAGDPPSAFTGCVAPNDDAVVRTYSSAAAALPVSFNVVFE